MWSGRRGSPQKVLKGEHARMVVAMPLNILQMHPRSLKEKKETGQVPDEDATCGLVVEL